MNTVNYNDAWNKAKDLETEFPDLPCDPSTGYCCSRGPKTYYDWEQDIVKPALEKAGYTNISFHMIESDSFGPLIRGVRAMGKSGPERWTYG